MLDVGLSSLFRTNSRLVHVRMFFFSVRTFLPAEIERAVFTTEPYAARERNFTELDRDPVLKGIGRR